MFNVYIFNVIIFLFIYLSIIVIIIYLFFILYILLTVGVIPFKVLPTLINVDVDMQSGFSQFTNVESFHRAL